MSIFFTKHFLWFIKGEHPEAMHAGEISLKTTNILLLLNVMLLEVIVKR